MRIYKIWPVFAIFFHKYIITLWPIGVFTPEDPKKMTVYTKNHEAIHWQQQKEFPILFYVWYLLEWLVKFFKYGFGAYYEISFEREAYKYRTDLTYLQTRKRFAWLKFVIKKL